MFTLALKQFSSNNLFSIFKANWIKFNLFTFFWGGGGFGGLGGVSCSLSHRCSWEPLVWPQRCWPRKQMYCWGNPVGYRKQKWVIFFKENSCTHGLTWNLWEEIWKDKERWKGWHDKASIFLFFFPELWLTPEIWCKEVAENGGDGFKTLLRCSIISEKKSQGLDLKKIHPGPFSWLPKKQTAPVGFPSCWHSRLRTSVIWWVASQKSVDMARRGDGATRILKSHVFGFKVEKLEGFETFFCLLAWTSWDFHQLKSPKWNMEHLMSSRIKIWITYVRSNHR